MIKVLADTNIIVSGLFFRGPERKFLELVLLGKIKLCLPEHVVLETQNIIQRKSKKLGNEIHANLMLKLVLGKSTVISMTEYKHVFGKAKTMIKDEKDAPILAAVLIISHDYFLSGDKHFKELKLKNHISTKELIGKIN